MPRGENISLDMKNRVINFYKNGQKQADIGRRLGTHKCIISRIIKQFNTFGNVVSLKRGGRHRKTTKAQDRWIKQTSEQDPFMSSLKIQHKLAEETGVSVCSRTVRNRLLEAGLHGRRPAKKPLLSKKNRRDRIRFARLYSHWTEHDWKKVIFSDESKFNLMNSDGMNYVRRPRGERLNPKYTVPTVKHGGGSVMVWGCFSGLGMGPLFRIQGNMDRFMYKDILQENLIPYSDEIMPLSHYFQHDNDPKHTSKFVKAWLRREKINVLEWPSQSPDLNPIENFWEILDRKVRDRTYGNVTELFVALSAAWKNMDPHVIDNLIKSMPKRLAEVIKNKGYFTKY